MYKYKYDWITPAYNTGKKKNITLGISPSVMLRNKFMYKMKYKV